MRSRSARHRSRPRSVLASLLVLVLLASGPAHALQARIRVFEGLVYAEPDPSAKVLERIAEGKVVSVDETSTNGWRRIRLSDGERIGWIQEASLALVAEPPATPPSAARKVRVIVWQAKVSEDAAGANVVDRLLEGATAMATGRSEGAMIELRLASGALGWVRADAVVDDAPKPVEPPKEEPAPEPAKLPSYRNRPRSVMQEPSDEPAFVYVRQPRAIRSFGALVDATEADPALHRRAEALVDDRTTALWVAASIAAVGLVLAGVGIALYEAPSSWDPDPDNTATWALIATGGVLAASSPLGMLGTPGDEDAEEIVNDWNARYLAAPLEWRTTAVVPVYIPPSR